MKNQTQLKNHFQNHQKNRTKKKKIFFLKSKNTIKERVGNMEIYYTIGNRRFLDVYMIKDRLSISKSYFQRITRKYPIKSDEIIQIQNKKLYSIDSLIEIVQNLKTEYEFKTSTTSGTKTEKV